MNVETYRAADGVNYSWLKWFLVTPWHALSMKDKEKDETLAMRLGKSVDEWVSFGRELPCVIRPEFNPSGDESDKWHGSKKWCKAWTASAKARPEKPWVYSQEEYDKEQGIKDALNRSQDFQRLLSIMPERQLAVFAEIDGVKCKALLDMAGRDAGGRRCFGDLKVFRDASPRGFGRDAYARHLDFQIVFYATILQAAENLDYTPIPSWAVAENGDAPLAQIYGVPEEAWESGEKKMRRALALYKECSETGRYPSYGEGWLTPIWPRYAD